MLVKGNTFENTLVGEIFYGLGVNYPVDIISNKFSSDMPPGNSAILVSGGSGDLKIENNTILSNYGSTPIAIVDKTGTTTLVNNKIDGVSETGLGAIGIVQSDNVNITRNNLMNNNQIQGWDTGVNAETGAFQIVFSTNVNIEKNKIKKQNLANCQVLNVPFIDTSNEFENGLKACTVPSN